MAGSTEILVPTYLPTYLPVCHNYIVSQSRRLSYCITCLYKCFLRHSRIYYFNHNSNIINFQFYIVLMKAVWY